jgi:hypothetical protein
MVMRYAPKAAWRRGDDPVHRWVKFHVVKAPIARVLPLCVGVLRASNYGAVLTRGVTEPPYVRHERLRKGPAPYYPMLPGFLVSTPAGRPDLTLIECPPSESLHRALPMLDGRLDIFAAESGFETSRMQAHEFHVWRGGRMIRSASAVWGFGKNRWRWREEGAPEPWEDLAAYKARRMADRITRPLLFAYAREWGIDPERHLFGRALENTVLIEGGAVMNAADDRPRTTEFQAEYARALSLGIGEPEPGDGGEEQREMWADAEARTAWMGRAAGAFNRLRSKKGATVEDAAKLHEKYDRELREAFGPDADPHPLDTWAASAAAGIDAGHAGTARLKREEARWASMRTLGFRLQQLLPEDVAEWPPAARLDGLRRRALKEADATGEAPEAVLPRLFFALCAETGTPVDAALGVPSMRAAIAAGFAEIVGGAGEFAAGLNADPTKDISVGTVQGKDDP